MSFEAIASIAAAEAAAKATVAGAEAKARQMLADSQSAGKLAVEAACDKAEGELQELNLRAAEKAKGGAEVASSELKNKKAALRARAEARLDEAASLVVERIVNS